MATAKKLASGSWNCKVYSHTEDILQADGSTKKKRIYKSFTCDIPGPKGKRKCDQLAAEWAATKEISIVTPNITVGEAIDKYIQQRSAVLAVYGARRSPFRFRTAAFRSKTAAHFLIN